MKDMMASIDKADKEVYKIVKKELERQQLGLEMIPSENNVSKAVLQAMGSILTINILKVIQKRGIMVETSL